MELQLSNEKEIINIIIIAICLLLLMAVTIILFFYLSRRKIIKTQLQKAQLEVSYQKEILQNTLVTQEEERKRIAQDLHDAISSKLNVVSLNASLLTEAGISSEETQRIGEGIHKVTATVLENSRRIAHDLLPPTLEKFGLKAALEELCEEVADTRKFQLSHSLNYKNAFLSAEKELHFFRIAQELFNNTIKHSQASHIRVTLETHENGVSLQYEDDGKGMDLTEVKGAKGLGMSGIENRAAILNAYLQIDSEPGHGILVKLTTKSLPNNANQSDTRR